MSKSTKLAKTSERSPASATASSVRSNSPPLSSAFSAREIPRCAKMSAILPMLQTSPPDAETRSSSVSSGGGVV
jgi:hypothetical protein